MDIEYVDIVDEEDNVLHQISKPESHQTGSLHRCVIAEVRDSKGRIMLVKQSSDRQDAGQHVSPVGGHVRSGETKEAALERETLEELGLETFDYKYIGKAIFNREVLGRKENHYFNVFEIYTDETPTLGDEAVDFVYYTEEELKRMLKEKPDHFGDAYYFVINQFYPHLLQ